MTDQPNEALSQSVKTKAAEYLAAMKNAAADGGNLEDYLSSEGVKAMRELTNAASLPGDRADEPTNLVIPQVIRVDDRGARNAFDIFSMMMQERVIYLNGEVNDQMAAIAVASIMYMDTEDSGKAGEEIKIYVNSPGGSVIAGFAIIDAMENSQSPVTTIGIGFQASMGSHILAAGDTRLMYENSLLMIHGIASGTQGKLTQQENDVDRTARLRDMGFANYIRHIGYNEKYWQLMDDETWFSAQQAKEIGFIDGVIPSRQGKKAVLAEGSANTFLFNQAAKREEKLPKTREAILAGFAAKDSEVITNRPEALVALSKFEYYWTPELKAKKDAEAQAANDNGAAQAAKKAANGGPNPS